jgi:hypothetical protein
MPMLIVTGILPNESEGANNVFAASAQLTKYALFPLTFM